MRVEGAAFEMIVSTIHHETITLGDPGPTLPTSDCTVFLVTHCGRTKVDFKAELDEIVYSSIAAVSETLLWQKTREQVQIASPWVRQIGIVDIRFMGLTMSDGDVVFFKSPLFEVDRSLHKTLAGMLPNTLVTNGPSAAPTNLYVRRALAVMDLHNLGFYTEALLTSFALSDDLLQVTVLAGLAGQNMSKTKAKAFLRENEDDRFKHYTCTVTKSCGWESLTEWDLALYADLLKVNSARNSIMHGSLRLDREEASRYIETLFAFIAWLETNPWGALGIPWPALTNAIPQWEYLTKAQLADAAKKQAELKNRSC